MYNNLVLLVFNQTFVILAPFRLFTIVMYFQKQPPKGVPRKRCSENMQQFYRRTHMPKCDFNKFALQIY